MSSTLMVSPSRWLAHSSCHGLNVSFARSFCIPMIVVFYGILPWGSTHDCINRNLSMQDLYELRGSVGTQECSLLLVPMHLLSWRVPTHPIPEWCVPSSGVGFVYFTLLYYLWDRAKLFSRHRDCSTVHSRTTALKAEIGYGDVWVFPLRTMTLSLEQPFLWLQR